MCGICGIIDWNNEEIDSTQLTKMRDIMFHRGPDAAGLHLESGVGLGHRRLSIIDLSEAGNQPMTNETEDIWLVFNGEIYNYRELRDELRQFGHRFSSKADSGILIHGFEEWGLPGLVGRIRGMFALAIWDRREKQLHLIRDHLGKKPLFFCQRDHRLYFASDIKAIWSALDGNLEVNPEAVDEFLYYYFITQDRTIFKGVYKLPPAHFATFSPSKFSSTCYWKPDYGQSSTNSPQDWLEGIDHHFRNAVRRRLISDVPLRSFLSGGIDSSCVCATVAKVTDEAPKTFTVGFSDQMDFDERPYSRTVAEHIGSDHTEMLLRPEISQHLSTLVWHYGEPFGDSSAMPSFLIAEAARKYVGVVLTGDGGDEAFAGYDRYLVAKRDRYLSRIPNFVKRNQYGPTGVKKKRSVLSLGSGFC